MIEAWLFLRIRPSFCFCQQLRCTTYTNLHGNPITGELLQVEREVVGLLFLVVAFAAFKCHFTSIKNGDTHPAREAYQPTHKLLINTSLHSTYSTCSTICQHNYYIDIPLFLAAQQENYMGACHAAEGVTDM